MSVRNRRDNLARFRQARGSVKAALNQRQVARRIPILNRHRTSACCANTIAIGLNDAPKRQIAKWVHSTAH
jgi:hypothetical protein